MFRNRIFKVMSNLILLAFFCTGQVAAAPNNSANEVKGNLSSTNSSISINDALPLVLKFTQQTLMAVGDTIRVSVDSSGAQGNGYSYFPAISADGRYVAFESSSSNLVSGDTNGMYDVFVRDTQTNTTTRISVASSGAQGDDVSWDPAISADGRYVAFGSYSTNLVSGDTNGMYDVFVRDTQTNITTRVSVDSSGAQGDRDSWHPSISADGRYVAFESSSSNLVSGDTNGLGDVFVRDTQTNTTTRISVDSSGAQGNGASVYPSIGGDGRYVAFESSSSNLVSGDTNWNSDVFVRDTQTNTTMRVSVDSSGAQGNGRSLLPAISADGRYVAFYSPSNNLVSGDTNGMADVFVRDTQTNTTMRVSVDSSGAQGNGYSYSPAISADGRYVAFHSFSNNLVSGDTNGNSDVFVRDTQTNTTMRVSVDSSGAQGNGHSNSPAISADGRYVAFYSSSSNLVSGDTNGSMDVFVHMTDVPIEPFLDLPFQYTNFSQASKGSNSGGYVNSWFDHTSPGYGNADGNLTTWLGPYQGTKDITRASCTTLGESCYDSHDGIDFRHVSDEVLAAAPGKVFGISYQPNGFGHFLYIDHQNCYASFYAHLKTAPTLQNGDTVTDRQQVGIMGNTGLSIGGGGGVHLHFGLYYDPTCDGDFSDKIVVDPYGWSGTGLDPWTTGPSRYLWKYAYDFAQQSMTSAGGSASTPSGNLAVTVPAGAVVDPVTLELWNTPPVAGASATLRSTGNSFWMRVLEWLTGGNSPAPLTATAATNSFDVPVTVTVHYDPTLMPHLDTSQLAIKQWDEVGLAWITLPTTLDTVNPQASAQTSQPGHFDLQAPLVCPVDTLEPNDNYDGSSITQVNGTLVNNLFDIAQDEDWFKFDATAGNNHVIQTTSLAAGVDTALEIYDMDGVTLLASNDNGAVGNASSLTWQAPQDGLYFARVKQALGSVFGCSAAYDFSVLDITPPTVFSSLRVNSSPTNAESVDFTVTFSESVMGVDTVAPFNDFGLTTSPGITGAFVTGVTPISGIMYTVSVNTGSGNGTIRLDVVDNNSIVDASLNPLGGAAVGDGNFTTGEVYRVIKLATFDDVSLLYWASSYIERLYSAGITGGCSQIPLNYCPENPVTRAQMAIFLLKGIHGSSYSPPAVNGSTGFSDVATNHWAAAWIKQLAVEGITSGCGGSNYCPEANVSRAQMAIFLLKAKHGTAYSPPTATGVFTDVPVNHWARNWIEQLAAEAITSGCGAGTYCPEDSVTRAQMAVFLVKTFNLP